MCWVWFGSRRFTRGGLVEGGINPSFWLDDAVPRARFVTTLSREQLWLPARLLRVALGGLNAGMLDVPGCQTELVTVFHHFLLSLVCFFERSLFTLHRPNDSGPNTWLFFYLTQAGCTSLKSVLEICPDMLDVLWPVDLVCQAWVNPKL